MNNQNRTKWRFGISSLLMLILLSAALMGWWNARKTAERYRMIIDTQQSRQAQRIDLIESAIESIYGKKVSDKQGSRVQRLFSNDDFTQSSFKDVVVHINDPAFRSASFEGISFANASITTGGSSFQHVSFDLADLRNAKLSAGAASFQGATFVGADLTGATLDATRSAFQAGTFRDAILHGTVFKCGSLSDFQVIDITNTDFSGADLSTIYKQCLESCYFSKPPKYNTNTKFPNGFDPVEQMWTLLSEQP